MANIEVYDRRITRVEFYEGSNFLGGYNYPDYATHDWVNVPPGTYSVTVRAIDSTGVTTISAPLAVTVNSPATSSFFNAGFEYSTAWGIDKPPGLVAGWNMPTSGACPACVYGSSKGSATLPGTTPVPEGIAAATLKSGGWLEQQVYLPAGDYKVTFQAAQLNGGTGTSVRVRVDGVDSGVYVPGSTFALVQSRRFNAAAAGMRTIRFEIVSGSTFVAIDDLKIKSVAASIGMPVVTASLTPAVVAQNGTSKFRIAVTTPTTATSLTGITFAQSFPAGVSISPSPNTAISAGCTGTLTTTGGVFRLEAGTFAVGTSTCNFDVDVRGTLLGNHTIPATEVDADNAILVSTQASVLGVYIAPTIAKAVDETTITLPATAGVTYTLGNPAGNTATFTSVTLTDVFATSPGALKLANLTIAMTPVSCATLTDATLAALAVEATGIRITAANLTPGATCQVKINLKANVPTSTTTPHYNWASAAVVGNVAGGSISGLTASVSFSAKPAFDVSLSTPTPPYVQNTPTVFVATASPTAGTSPTFTFYLDGSSTAIDTGITGTGSSRTLTLSNLAAGSHTVKVVVESATLGQSQASQTIVVNTFGFVLTSEAFSYFVPADVLFRATISGSPPAFGSIYLYQGEVQLPQGDFGGCGLNWCRSAIVSDAGAKVFTARMKDSGGAVIAISNPITLSPQNSAAPESAKCAR